MDPEAPGVGARIRRRARFVSIPAWGRPRASRQPRVYLPDSTPTPEGTRPPWAWPSPRPPRAGPRDVPVGAVALVAGRVVASRHNERELTGDPTAHAEILALADAATALGRWRLTDVTLVVTLEPCPMCAGALVAARLGRIVFGRQTPRPGRAARSTTCAPTPV